MSKNIVITQSNYIPWKGYFDAIALSDEFVFYDDMQYTKRDWRNRNLIKTENGLKWLTIPVEVKGKFFQKIKDTKISDKKWGIQHWAIIQQSYQKAPFFKEYKDILEPLYRNMEYDFLVDVNYKFIFTICELLEIKTNFHFSSSFVLQEERTERLLQICKDLEGSAYYSGPAAKAYMNESIFEKAGINLHYLEYTKYPVYPQLYEPFTHGVSILDLLFNTGKDAKNSMLHVK